ncbi:MAG: hypothetical protein R3Y64_10495 [Peptostreptococcaceae bacterium]
MKFDLSQLYLVPLGLAFFIGFVNLVLLNISSKSKIMVDKPFALHFANELYALSYLAPFKWFIREDEKHPEVIDIKELIVSANETHRLNYKSFTVFKYLMFIILLVIALILSHFAVEILELSNILFNLDTDVNDSDTLAMFRYGFLSLSLTSFLLPRMYLKIKTSRIEFKFLKDLPILQLFIILMIKAKKPLNEILFVLSNTKMVYKPIFETGYRIYIRDKEEGLKYLEEAFKNTQFLDTIQIFKEYGDYAKNETLQVLETGLVDITEHTNSYKRKKDIFGNLLSQLIVALPFISAVLLGMTPLIYYGLEMMSIPM